MAYRKILVQMEQIQLQIKPMDHKITLLAKKEAGLDLNDSCEDHQQILVETTNYPLV